MQRVLKFYWRWFTVLGTPMIAVRGTAELTLGMLLFLYPAWGKKVLIYLPCVMLAILLWDLAMGFFDEKAQNNNWRMFCVGLGVAGLVLLIIWPLEMLSVTAGYLALVALGYAKSVISGSEGLLGRFLCLLQAAVLGYLSWILFPATVIKSSADLFGVVFLSLGVFDWVLSPLFAKLNR